LDAEKLARTSRLAARVDNNAISDGFQLYLHSFVITRSGQWAVVQQGLNSGSRLARRYHWHSATVRGFTCEPHSANILNLTDARALRARNALLEITRQRIDTSLSEFRKLAMPAHHDVRAEHLHLKRLGAVLAVAHERELVILPRCCWWRVSVRGRFNRWPSSPR